MTDDDGISVTYEARRQARAEDRPSRPRPWRRRLIIGGGVLLGIVAVVVAVLVWYSLTHVTTVRAQVCGAVVTLAPNADARMLALYVRPGQRVQALETLARLDDSELRAALASAEAGGTIRESEYAQAKANKQLIEARIQAEIALAQARVAITKGRLLSAEEALCVRRALAPEEVRQAQAQHDESRARLDRLKKGPRKEQIETAKARLETAKARATLYELEVKQAETLVRKSIESPLTLEVKRTALIAQQNDVREAELMLAQLLGGATEEEIDVAENTLVARDAAVSIARLGAQELKILGADVAIRQAEISEAEAAVRQAEARRLEITLAGERVKAAEAELKRAQADVEGRRAALQGMTVVSPVAGTVIRTFDHVGEVCRRGVPTILVADDSAGRWIEGYIHENDAQRLKVGQTARVEMVMGSGEYVKAKVEDVALATSSLSRSNPGESLAGSGQAGVELVWVKLRPTQEIRSLPGMTARAVIRVTW